MKLYTVTQADCCKAIAFTTKESAQRYCDLTRDPGPDALVAYTPIVKEVQIDPELPVFEEGVYGLSITLTRDGEHHRMLQCALLEAHEKQHTVRLFSSVAPDDGSRHSDWDPFLAQTTVEFYFLTKDEDAALQLAYRYHHRLHERDLLVDDDVDIPIDKLAD